MPPQTSWANSFYLILCFPEKTQDTSAEWKNEEIIFGKEWVGLWEMVMSLEYGIKVSKCRGSCCAMPLGHLRSPSIRKETINTLRDQLKNTQLEPFPKLCSITFPPCGPPPPWDRVSNIPGPGGWSWISRPPGSTSAVLCSAGITGVPTACSLAVLGIKTQCFIQARKTLNCYIPSPPSHVFNMSLLPETSLKQPQVLSLFLYYSLFLWQPESSKTQHGAASKLLLRVFTTTWCIQDAAHLVLHGLQSWPPRASAHHSYTRLFGSDVNTSWWPSFPVWTHNLRLACNKIIHLLMANALSGRIQVSHQP